MTVAAMLSNSLLARWLTKIASFLNFECYSDPSRLLLSSGSWLGVAYAGINKQAADTSASRGESTRRVLTGGIAIAVLLSDD